jgi:hypothetical protein
MSSVSRGYSQPITQSIAVVTADAWLHDLEDIVTSFEPGSYVKTGSIYLVDTRANLDSFINSVKGGNGDGVHQRIDARTSLKDMGKDLIVGLQGGESKILTFRLIQVQNSNGGADSGADGIVGYVIAENKLFADDGLGVRIARI